MLANTHLEKVIDIGPGVFQTAKNETMIFIVHNGVHPTTDETTHVILTEAKTFPRPSKEFLIKQNTWADNPNATWLVKVAENDLVVWWRGGLW